MALAASRGRGDFRPIAPHPVLIAAELQRLLEPAQLEGLDVTWIAADQPTPTGDYVAIVPLLTRWVGGTEFKSLPKLKIVANCAAGHDNVDVVAAELRGITVTNTPDARPVRRGPDRAGRGAPGRPVRDADRLRGAQPAPRIRAGDGCRAGRAPATPQGERRALAARPRGARDQRHHQ